jgi:hypothetical protein
MIWDQMFKQKLVDIGMFQLWKYFHFFHDMLLESKRSLWWTKKTIESPSKSPKLMYFEPNEPNEIRS